MKQPVFRFAPSPNGKLHLGHAYSALLNVRLAEANQGQFLLRLENIDRVRCLPEFEQAIYDDLSWLGLSWPRPVRRQSEYFDVYRSAFAQLQKSGLIYPCFCSRKEITCAADEEGLKTRDPDGALLYPGTCRHLSLLERENRIAQGADHAWRLDMKRALAAISGELYFSSFSYDAETYQMTSQTRCLCHPEQWGDPIIVRKETPTSYHLAVVVDDALQKVSHVVRGKDLEAATDLHVLLQKLLDLPTPLYHHHALIIGENGEKLSKSLFSKPLEALRRSGLNPEEIRRLLGFTH